MRNATTVILANGDFPRKGGEAWRLLAGAARVVACDGAARAYRRRFGRWPTVVIGDLDSLGRRPADCRVVRVDDQETNDLTKALRYCAQEGWKDPVVLGAGGKREDHLIGNVFRALEAGVRTVTDHGIFHPVCGKATFRTAKGAAVSVFAPDPRTKMTSQGLEWPLEGVRFANLHCATLNRAAGRRVTVSSDRPVYVYIAN